MNEGRELIEALGQIEKEKGIDKEILLEAIENSLLAACKNEYGKSDKDVYKRQFQLQGNA